MSNELHDAIVRWGRRVLTDAVQGIRDIQDKPGCEELPELDANSLHYEMGYRRGRQDADKPSCDSSTESKVRPASLLPSLGGARAGEWWCVARAADGGPDVVAWFRRRPEACAHATLDERYRIYGPYFQSPSFDSENESSLRKQKESNCG